MQIKLLSTKAPEAKKFAYQPDVYHFKGKLWCHTSANLSIKDIFNGWKSRWGINRINYSIKPGLYALGSPDSSSDILVTTNYKLTFDKLRKELNTLSVWILVLNSAGINVWCAAGKGTLSSKQLIGKIRQYDLAGMVIHKRIILPQLAAVGVAAHEVTKATGFKVLYGPVRAADLKAFITSGYQKTPLMSRVTFSLSERMAVIPVEIVLSWKYLAVLIPLAFIFATAMPGKYFLSAFKETVTFAGAVITGTVLVPLMLPWLPFRAFVLKGAVAGIIWLTMTGLIFNFSFSQIISNILLLAPVTAFLSMNFTGATTFTSQSGTTLEVKRSIIPIFISSIIGLILKVITLVWR